MGLVRGSVARTSEDDDTYLLQLGFHPVVAVSSLVQKYKRQHKKRNVTRNNTETVKKKQNTQNRKKYEKTNIKRTL